MQGLGEGEQQILKAPFRQGFIHSPLVIAELVAMVISWDDVCKEDVLGFGVHSCYLDLIAREHPPAEEWGRKGRDTFRLRNTLSKRTLTSN